MPKNDLLFYDAYEHYYKAVEQNSIFPIYCARVFGIYF
jgi:hypothetical protein